MNFEPGWGECSSGGGLADSGGVALCDGVAVHVERLGSGQMAALILKENQQRAAYVLTGVHFAHLVIGAVLLPFMSKTARRPHGGAREHVRRMWCQLLAHGRRALGRPVPAAVHSCDAMKSIVQKGLNTVWLAPVLATWASWWLGVNHSPSTGAGTTIGTVAVLAIAFAKVRYIGLWFMELRTAPRHHRFFFAGWVYMVGFTLIAL